MLSKKANQHSKRMNDDQRDKNGKTKDIKMDKNHLQNQYPNYHP